MSEEDETPADPVAQAVLDKMFGPPFSERETKLVAELHRLRNQVARLQRDLIAARKNNKSRSDE